MVGDPADPISPRRARLRRRAFDRAAALAAMVRGADAGLPQRQRRIRRAPGAGVLPAPTATSPSTSTPATATPTRSTATPKRSGARRRPRSSTRSTTSRSPSSPPASAHDHRDLRAHSSAAPPTGADLFEPAQRDDRAALRQRRLPEALRQPQRRRLRRGRLRPVHLDGPAGPRRPDRAMGGPATARRRASTASSACSTAARARPTPTTPCSATSRPCRRPGSTTGCGGPTRPRRRCAARCSRLYCAAPDGYPGNDDLGTLSAWYVFGALGHLPGGAGGGSPGARRRRSSARRNPPAHRRRALIARSDAERGAASHVKSARRRSVHPGLRLDGHATPALDDLLRARPRRHARLRSCSGRPNRRWGAADRCRAALLRTAAADAAARRVPDRRRPGQGFLAELRARHAR